ncbi:MAG: F0F1 ATP synthase subunit A [Planctomycetes bacterium]|nr:F0F1 ATP synthase subunit A [Planctomycetota bacterium]
MNFGLTLASGDDLMSHVLPHKVLHDPLFEIGGIKFYLTNHVLMTLIVAVAMLIIFPLVAAKVKPRGTAAADYVTRGKFAQFFESICEFLRTEVARPALGHLTDRYIGFIWTTFFFILFCNLLGMMPVGPVLRFATGNPHAEHWGGAATGNIAITAGLAIVAFFVIHGIGIKENGIKYFAHFNPGPWYMAPLLVPLEIIGSLVKPFALCVRLFANMVAGHLVLGALLGLIFTFRNYGVAAGSVLGAAALSLLELFVAFLQAYIFTFLTVLFIAAGAVHEHEHGEHENHDDVEEYGHHEPAGLEHAVVREPPHSKTLP